jgi:hypothetical protein
MGAFGIQLGPREFAIQSVESGEKGQTGRADQTQGTDCARAAGALKRGACIVAELAD